MVWLVKRLYLVVAFLVGLLIVVVSIKYYQPDFSEGFLIGKEGIFSFYRFALYAHIIGAPLALFVGIFQFLKPRNKIHKTLGKTYIGSILLAAPSGLIMAFWAIGGALSTINFLLMSILWIWFTLKSYGYIAKGNVPKHRQFMTRSFILTNSAIMIRLFSFINNQYELTDVTAGYMIISWLSWLPWLGIYELKQWLKMR